MLEAFPMFLKASLFFRNVSVFSKRVLIYLEAFPYSVSSVSLLFWTRFVILLEVFPYFQKRVSEKKLLIFLEAFIFL